MKVAFFGLGNMGQALICGAIRSKFLKAGEIIGFDVDRVRSSQLKSKSKIKVASSSGEAILGARYIFLCVKPQQMQSLFSEISGQVRSNQCLVSIAAGVPSKKIEAAFQKKVSVIRVMPNTPALVQSGVSAVAKGSFAGKKDLDFALKFFASVGKAVVLPEEYFDAVTAVSGSGPAYLFYLTEILEKAADALGLPKEVSVLFSRHTFIGAAKMLAESVASAADLRKAVTSPGGTTEAAVRFLEENRWPQVFAEAVRKAKDRSQELSSA